MLHYFKFHRDVRSPVPAREVYLKHRGGRGWPEECPPLRAANAYGWDVLATFPMTFRRRRDGTWRLDGAVDVEADWVYDPGPRPAARRGAKPRAERRAPPRAPLTQRNAWFWDRGQVLPHRITDEVWERLKNQVKVSTYLFLATDPGELLQIGDLPNWRRPFRALSALLDTDWYPASYPWHCVLELDPAHRTIEIPAGIPLCRLVTLPRVRHAARPMAAAEFDRFFAQGQEWLARHGKGPPSEMMDITGVYAKRQEKSRFTVKE